MSNNIDNFGNIIPEGWELNPVWGNICGAIQPKAPNANLDKSHPLRDMIQVQPEEVQPFDGWEGCWAGDGSGMDDFADWNAQEGCDS